MCLQGWDVAGGGGEEGQGGLRVVFGAEGMSVVFLGPAPRPAPPHQPAADSELIQSDSDTCSWVLSSKRQSLWWGTCSTPHGHGEGLSEEALLLLLLPQAARTLSPSFSRETL